MNIRKIVMLTIILSIVVATFYQTLKIETLNVISVDGQVITASKETNSEGIWRVTIYQINHLDQLSSYDDAREEITVRRLFMKEIDSRIELITDYPN